MARNGTVILLGAGASAEAGYPTAAALLDEFEALLGQATQSEIEERDRALAYRRQAEQEALNAPPNRFVWLPPLVDEPAIGEWFRDRWQFFEQAASKVGRLAVPPLTPDGRPDLPSQPLSGQGGTIIFPPYAPPQERHPAVTARKPYLESFFAFYDELLRPLHAAALGDGYPVRAHQHRFRELRDIAIRVAYRVLTAYQRSVASYLRRLLDVPAPEGYRCAIATLNFDPTVEQTAALAGVDLFDGFSAETDADEPVPPDFYCPGLENLQRLWRAVARKCHRYVGCDRAGPGARLLLKLHGSLGWYTVEEGNGDIGWRDELRHNTVYAHFRLPYEVLWRPDMAAFVDQIALGGTGDLVTQSDDDAPVPTRKAGAVWVRPYMIYARALKTHPDRLFIDLFATFSRLLDRAANVLVIGYSWSDPHINDLVLDAVAGGANLVNVSRSPQPDEAIALWAQRFPTTFAALRHRLFTFGGGARSVLEANTVLLPSGQQQTVDVLSELERGLPAELSIAHTP